MEPDEEPEDLERSNDPTAREEPVPAPEIGTEETVDHEQGVPEEQEPRQEPRKERPRRGCAGRVLGALGVLVALLALVALYQAVTWPDVAALATENPETTAFIERWESRSERPAARTWVPYARISPHLKRAVLVAEDIDFFSHAGFATGEIRSALEKAWEEKRPPRGASTITQQLAKNLWLSPSRNPLRKAKEALLTVQLEENLPKRRILEIYLNVVELGPGIYGAEAAARHYYGKSAAELSEAEAAALAASLPNPDDWHPGATSRRYQARVELVRRRMARARFLWKVI